MRDVAESLNLWIKDEKGYQAILERLGVSFDTIIWSDDVAVPWMTESADQLLPELQALFTKVSSLFEERGFLLNLARGKTSILLTYRGRHAPCLRRDLLVQPRLCREERPTC